MVGVKISYEIAGEKGIEKCFTWEALLVLLGELKACEDVTGLKAKMEFDLYENPLLST